jgi:TonB family protein
MPRVLFYSFLLLLVPGAVARSQSPAPSPSPTPKECTSPVYETTELDKKAKVTQGPSYDLTDEEIQRNRGSALVGRALLCGSGKITNVGLIYSGAPDLNEKFLEAIRKVRFVPARKNGENVSQWMQFEFKL